MREEDLYCEDIDENRRFSRYHRLAKNQSSESEGYVERIEREEDDDRPSRRASNYFDAIWEGRTR
ncbi:hypothetical protein [Candidatus Manganitrophus noduliformans]|uniref:Uncharacterized protein n=1 Tax=Candidatus Manganitrophus noduliformans TaxID=2606439 RepID=A0A7X6ICN8_9BACT|nr:hypothetical protein [Candidatus Manganitrophus noduliformans]NKE73016.1 hypothetical protein [Candidatus Manganitrophus noduliformans]